MKPKTSKILKELRASNSKTQREIAEFLGITRQAYSRYESSLREPSLETLAKLAEFYNVSPQIFFVGDIDKPIDDDMSIVELSALYQAKKAGYAHSKDDKSLTQEENTEDEISMDKIEKLLYTKLDVKVAEPEKEETAFRKNFNKYKMYVFYALIILFTINIGMMTVHRLDPNYEYSIFKHSFINAISPDQNVSATMYTDIVKITEFKSDEVEIGDLVVIYSDFGVDDYWVEEITSIDDDNQEISTTYDGITSIKTPFEDVLGTYQKSSNIFGTLYFTAKFNTGFLLLTTGHLLILASFYYSFVEEKK